MKKLLLAYDGSAGAEIALRDLVHGGFRSDMETKVLTLADVVLPPALAEESAYDLLAVAKPYEKVAEILRSAKRTAIHGAQLMHELFPDWTVTHTARADSPAWGILAEANRWYPDLIVLGSHGRTPLGRFFLGSVSHRVAVAATRSVRVARPRKHSHDQPERLLVGVDGSLDSELAAQQVLHRNWGAGTRIELVTVIDERLKSRAMGASGLIGNAYSVDRIEDSVRSRLDSLRDLFPAEKLDVRCHIFEGDPKATLLRQADDWNIDCVFLGARGMDHGDRMYLGTLASAVCTRVDCTVEIVRASRMAQTGHGHASIEAGTHRL